MRNNLNITKPSFNRESHLRNIFIKIIQAHEILGDKFNAKDYNQRHGWVVRGDLEKPGTSIYPIITNNVQGVSSLCSKNLFSF